MSLEFAALQAIKRHEDAICFMAVGNAPPPLEWIRSWLMLRFGLARKQETA